MITAAPLSKADSVKSSPVNFCPLNGINRSQFLECLESNFIDVISQSKIREFVKYYNECYKTTFVITSHYTKDIQEMCQRVLVLNKGSQIYDGLFNDLIKAINPERRLVFEFSDGTDLKYLDSLHGMFEFQIYDNILTAQLPESQLRDLLSKLLENFSPQSMSFEDLPVEETMRSFFQSPQDYL